MRIAIVIDGLATGGAENQCTISAVELTRAGHDVSLLTYHPRNDYEEFLRQHDLTAECVAAGRGRLRRIGPLAARLRSRQFDVVHCFKENASITGCIAGRIGGASRVLAGCRSSMRCGSAPIRWLKRQVFRHAAGWIVNSDGGRRRVIQDYGVPAQRIFLVRNAVHPEKYRSSLNVFQAKERLGISPTGPVVTMVANLRPEKNHDMFLRVAQRLSRHRPDAWFLAAGHGPLEEGIRAKAVAMGLSSCFRLLGRCTAMADLLRGTDVVVLTSGEGIEGLPNALIEAGAAGIPCVATRCGAEEVVVEGRTGYVVEPEDDQAMTDRVLALVEDRDRWQSMSRAAMSEVSLRFSPEAMTRSLMAAYEGRGA